MRPNPSPRPDPADEPTTAATGKPGGRPAQHPTTPSPWDPAASRGLSTRVDGIHRAITASGRSTLAKAVAAGHSIRLAPNVAVTRERWRGTDWRERRRLTCIAHGLAHPGLTLMGVSAARVHRLPLLDDPDADVPELVELLRPTRGATKTTSSQRIRAISSAAGDTTVVDGVRVTSVGRTVHDLLRGIGPAQALTAADAALRRGHGRGDLARTSAILLGARAPGAKDTATIFALASELSDSPGESWTKWLIHLADVGTMLQQVTITDADGVFIARVDFWLPDLQMAIQFDGHVKYSGHFGNPDVISTRENRQARDLGNCGVLVLQLTWAMLADGRALNLIRAQAIKRRRLLDAAGAQFTGETFLRHEKLPERVTRHFRRR